MIGFGYPVLTEKPLREVQNISRTSKVTRSLPLILATLFVVFVLIDFVLRPKFIPIYPGSDEKQHEAPFSVSASHFILNIMMPFCGALMFIYGKGNLARLKLFFICVTLLVVSVICSLFVSASTKSIVYLFLLQISFLGAGLWASSRYGRAEGLNDLYRYISVGLTATLILVLSLGEFSWGRLAARAGPNYWGMIAFIAATLSVCLPKMYCRLIVLSVSFWVLILTQARGSLVATVIAILVSSIITFKHTPAGRKGWLVIGAVFFLIMLTIFSSFIAESILLLSDPRRGIGSGGTGRAGAWQEAINAFSSHPIFGVGYRQHEKYVTQASNAHNAYLAIATELGVFGLIFYCILIFGAVWRSLSRAWRFYSTEATASSSLIVGFAFIGLVEYQALATGSPLPNLVFFCLAVVWSTSKQYGSGREKSAASTRSGQTSMGTASKIAPDTSAFLHPQHMSSSSSNAL